jgi:LytR cell envelope-related transcriptional attenuator
MDVLGSDFDEFVRDFVAGLLRTAYLLTGDRGHAEDADRAETTNTNTLRQLGFHIGTVHTAPTPVASTVVEYPAGMEAQAATVAAHVPGTTIQQTDTVQQVTLLLGQDGRSVTAPTPNTRAPAGASSSGVTNAQQASTGCIY